jgi:hypothetical protein
MFISTGDVHFGRKEKAFNPSWVPYIFEGIELISNTLMSWVSSSDPMSVLVFLAKLLDLKYLDDTLVENYAQKNCSQNRLRFF